MLLRVLCALKTGWVILNLSGKNIVKNLPLKHKQTHAQNIQTVIFNLIILQWSLGLWLLGTIYMYTYQVQKSNINFKQNEIEIYLLSVRSVKSRRITIMELSASRKNWSLPQRLLLAQVTERLFQNNKIQRRTNSIYNYGKEVNVHKLQENLNKRHDYQIVYIWTTHESLNLFIVQMTSNFLSSSSLDSRDEVSCKLITKPRVI